MSGKTKTPSNSSTTSQYTVSGETSWNRTSEVPAPQTSDAGGQISGSTTGPDGVATVAAKTNTANLQPYGVVLKAIRYA